MFKRESYLFWRQLYFYFGGEDMSDLGTLLGNGRYIFFKSLAQVNSSELREAYGIASGRVNAANILLSGKDLQGTKQTNATPEMTQFNTMITSYLNKLKTLAASMRANEITYIQDLIAQFEKDTKNKLLKAEDKKKLKKLLTAEKISANEYMTLITALNKVQYADKQKEFANTIKTQINNISLLKTNFEEADEQKKKEITQAYNDSYGKYSKQYASMVVKGNKIKEVINGEIVEHYARMQQSNLDNLAKKINSTLEHLASNDQFIALIRSEYKKHLEETDFTIVKNDFMSYIIDQIIEEVRSSPSARGKTRAKNIANKIMASLSSDKNLRDLSSSSQAYKITNKKSDANQGEKLLKALIGGRGSANVVNILMDIENIEEIIQDIIPDKAPQLISKINDIKKKIQSATTDAEKDIIKTEKNSLSKELRTEFRNTDLGKDLVSAISNDKDFNIETILKDHENNFLNKVKSDLSGLAIKVKKSALAELMASNRARSGITKALHSEIGGSFNLKDDVMFAISTHKVVAPKESEINQELQSAINQINNAISQVVSSYTETYYKRDKNSEYANEKTGTTNTKKAREDYEKVMSQLLDKLSEIYNKANAEIKKELDKYAQNTHNFIGSISVKEYSLYQDTLGFHGGTLGPTAMKAMENIQEMYLQGGISIIDMATLEFALLNCADAAIGGATLRGSLESYLLGGAALMMFDEGFGEAIPYLKKMESTVMNLMPQNLNLYQLNSAYVPASFIVESIYQNLQQFYSLEYSNCVTDFIEHNKVIINNPTNEGMAYITTDITEAFAKTSEIALNNTTIQFVFMAGMLDIFKNLGKAFDVK